MDLRTAYPRSLKETVGGYVHLGRMIDKCRAVLAGTQGEYRYPCPLDQRLLKFAGLTAEEFLDTVRRSTDQEVVQWFLKSARPRDPKDIQAWNREMLTLSPDTDEQWGYFRNLRDAIDRTRADITTWADLLDLEEQRSVPVQHTRPGARQ